MKKWFNREWWKYLLAKPERDSNYLKAIICRHQGHTYDVVWYNPSGLEPDMHCRNCGDDLG